MKKGSFFKIASLNIFALLSVFSFQSAVAQGFTYEPMTESQYEVYDDEAVVEETGDIFVTEDDVPVCYDENDEEISCDMVNETESEIIDEETYACYDENNEVVPCE